MKWIISENKFRGLRTLTIFHIRYGEGFIIVFAIDNIFSFDEVDNLRKQIQRVKDADDFSHPIWRGIHNRICHR